MYTPKHFEEPRIEVMHELMRARSLATVVTFGSGAIAANHLPLHLSTTPAPLGTLYGHVARANPVWRDLDPNVQALAIFEGPGAYVSPSWYETRKTTGRAVPTWNYVVAHARGFLRLVEDPAWLRAHLEALTRHQESEFTRPWTMSDAPSDYIEGMMGAIVGIEIVVTRLEGKWKVSQNQPPENQRGVIAGLSKKGDEESLAIAALVKTRGAADAEPDR